MSKATELVKEAKKLAAQAPTWADLSNALFAPASGLVAKAFPTPQARAAFARTPQYQQIRKMISQAMDRRGLVEGATPQKSGRFVVRVPKSLHAALEREASAEGVSLNQLVVAKLALRLDRVAAGRSR